MKNFTITMILVLIFASVSFGQVEFPKEIKVSGYAIIDVPVEEGDKYNVGWARIQFETKPTSKLVNLRFEYDVWHGKVSYAFIRKVWETKVGTFTGTLGRALTATALCYEGPSSIKTTHWGEGYSGFGIYTLGSHLTYTRGKLELNVTHQDDGFIASVCAGPIKGFWEEHTGYGFVFDNTFNRFMGLESVYSHREGGLDQYSVRNYANVYGDFWVNGIANFGFKESYVAGCTYEYSPKSFVKAYMEFAPESHPTPYAQVTFVF